MTHSYSQARTGGTGHQAFVRAGEGLGAGFVGVGPILLLGADFAVLQYYRPPGNKTAIEPEAGTTIPCGAAGALPAACMHAHSHFAPTFLLCCKLQLCSCWLLGGDRA